MDMQVLCVFMLEYFWSLFILLINHNLHSIVCSGWKTACPTVEDTNQINYAFIIHHT